MSEWISIGEAAKYLGISRDTLRRWEKRGKIKAQRSPTNRRYYTKAQLDNVLSGKTEKVSAKTSKKTKKATIENDKWPTLIIIGIVSLIIASILAVAAQLSILK